MAETLPKKNIIQQGEEAKFTVEITHDGFDMATDDFRIILHYGMLGKSVTITKSEMDDMDDGKYMFSFDTSGMSGRVTVECVYELGDIDLGDGSRTKTDRQYLCFVATTPCPRFACVPCGCGDDGRKVHYEMVDESGISSDYIFLTDSRGRYLITDDDEFIIVRKELLTT